MKHHLLSNKGIQAKHKIPMKDKTESDIVKQETKPKCSQVQSGIMSNKWYAWKIGDDIVDGGRREITYCLETKAANPEAMNWKAGTEAITMKKFRVQVLGHLP